MAILSTGVRPDPRQDGAPKVDAAGSRYLVNAAFLQEIKDSNPHLWHQTHDVRTLCQLQPDDFVSPQQTIKKFVHCLDELRDLLSLQFTLEEAYGFIQVPSSPSLSPVDRREAEESEAELQSQQIRMAIDQHRRLYLQLVDLVEESEELQYRGCDQECLRTFAESVTRFSRDLTSHERLEAELIRFQQHGRS